MTMMMMMMNENMRTRVEDLEWTVLHYLDELNRVEVQLKKDEETLEDLYFEKDRLERLRLFICRRHRTALSDISDRSNWGEIESFVPCTMKSGAWEVGFYLTPSIARRMRAELEFHQNAEKFWRRVHDRVERRLHFIQREVFRVETYVRNLTRALRIREENLDQSDALFIEASFDLSVGTVEENHETERLLEPVLRPVDVLKRKPSNLRNVGGASWKLYRHAQPRAAA